MNKPKFYLDVRNYIEKHSEISALDLCNDLIENHGFSDKTFSTGRYRLYVDVVAYLEKLLKSHSLKAVERNRVDCKYEVLTVELPDPLPPSKVKEDKKEIEAIEDFEDGEVQLSLF